MSPNRLISSESTPPSSFLTPNVSCLRHVHTQACFYTSRLIQFVLFPIQTVQLLLSASCCYKTYMPPVLIVCSHHGNVSKIPHVSIFHRLPLHRSFYYLLFGWISWPHPKQLNTQNSHPCWMICILFWVTRIWLWCWEALLSHRFQATYRADNAIQCCKCFILIKYRTVLSIFRFVVSNGIKTMLSKTHKHTNRLIDWCLLLHKQSHGSM